MLDRGEPSQGMTVVRTAKLTALGLLWKTPREGHANDPKWEAHLAKLAAYMCTTRSTATATCRGTRPRTHSSPTR
jgi:hypothetical protein